MAHTVSARSGRQRELKRGTFRLKVLGEIASQEFWRSNVGVSNLWRSLARLHLFLVTAMSLAMVNALEMLAGTLA